MAGRRKLPQCSATAQRTGEQCKAKALPGTTVCRQHGGSLPTVAAAADRRVAQAQIARITERLGVVANPDDPFEAASAAMRQLRHMAQEYGAAVMLLGPSGSRYEHEKSGEQIRGEVVVYQQTVKTLAELSLAVIRAGLDAKLTEINEAQSRAFVSFIHEVLARFGLDAYSPEVAMVVESLLEQIVRGEEPATALPSAPGEWPGGPSPVCDMSMHEKCRAYMVADWLPGPPPPWPERCTCPCHRPVTAAEDGPW